MNSYFVARDSGINQLTENKKLRTLQSILTLHPFFISPLTIFSAKGVTINCSIARASGRAPHSKLKPSVQRKFMASCVADIAIS